MGLWRLLGGEVNWERVARMHDKGVITDITSAITDALGGGTNNIPLSIDRLNDDDKNNVMWVLEKFGRNIPTTAKYPWLKNGYLDAENINPRHVAKYDRQKDWDQAWEWYDEYKKGAIPFLEYRIQIREKELDEHENTLNEIKSREKLSRDAKYLIKSYTKKIPAQRVEIVKLKAELESLKAKEIQTQPELTLENENLRLKKEILEIELKLKEANRER
ncbi:hypothetical protein [Spiroplasma mirum]|uniref:hypothetical protein n=1 Tax=Spiroplasma mirum TaxID=2144 RepID=UPI00064B58F0|nr:hypothetical protein [Spiroplasma atrichopogonis]AKM52747.1 hypothetical protein SATRI_v1c01810 [Spiroplasma atrichopogonis]